jgi:hypothetical protein
VGTRITPSSSLQVMTGRVDRAWQAIDCYGQTIAALTLATPLRSLLVAAAMISSDASIRRRVVELVSEELRDLNNATNATCEVFEDWMTQFVNSSAASGGRRISPSKPDVFHTSGRFRPSSLQSSRSYRPSPAEKAAGRY